MHDEPNSSFRLRLTPVGQGGKGAAGRFAQGRGRAAAGFFRGGGGRACRLGRRSRPQGAEEATGRRRRVPQVFSFLCVWTGGAHVCVCDSFVPIFALVFFVRGVFFRKQVSVFQRGRERPMVIESNRPSSGLWVRPIEAYPVVHW